MFNFEGGQLRNAQSNLCLQPQLDKDGKMDDMANVWAETCEEAVYQKFDFIEHDPKFDSKNAATPSPPPATQTEATQNTFVKPSAYPMPAAPPAVVAPVMPAVSPPPVVVTPPPPVAPPPVAEAVVVTPEVVTAAPVVSPRPPLNVTPEVLVPDPVVPPPVVPAPVPAPPLLTEAKFQAAPKTDFLEMSERGQAQVPMGVACIALLAVVTRAVWRRAPTGQHTLLLTEE